VQQLVGVGGVVAALSVTSDLTRGHPPGEAMRACLVAGGRIESTTEPLLGVQDMSGEVLTAIGAIVDSQLPAKISEDINRKLRQIKASGFIYNSTFAVFRGCHAGQWGSWWRTMVNDLTSGG
jgi:hypothetical protein